MNKSIRWLGVAMMVLFASLAAQLVNLQVVQAGHLKHSALNTREVVADFSKPRGVIQTADGLVLAQSVPSNDQFKYQRVYPHGLEYSFITGYFSFRYGAEGIEREYGSQLAGRNLPITVHNLLSGSGPRTANLTLTVRASMQDATAAALGSRVGAVVAIDPRDGSVISLVSQPSYDPTGLASHSSTAAEQAFTSLSADPGRPMLPRAYRESYAPGSTFKTVTASAVFDRNPSLATKSYPVLAALPLPLTGQQLHNFGGETCGGQLPDLFTFSCDTGFGAVGLDLGAAALSGEAFGFGFGSVPPLDLPGVFASKFPPASFFAQRTPLVAYSAIGQDDVTATPLQMALVAAGIANHGVIMTPHLMKQIRDSEGAVVASYAPRPWLTATSPGTAAQMTALMQSVVQRGTGTSVAIPGVAVAAKTGTAEVTSSLTNAWMIAFAPADNPTIAVAAVLPGLHGVGNEVTGAVNAGPVVRAVIQAWLQQGGH